MSTKKQNKTALSTTITTPSKTFIGIDFHKRYSVYHVVDEAGKDVAKGRIEHSTPDEFGKLVKRFPGCRVTFEATMDDKQLSETIGLVLGAVAKAKISGAEQVIGTTQVYEQKQTIAVTVEFLFKNKSYLAACGGGHPRVQQRYRQMVNGRRLPRRHLHRIPRREIIRRRRTSDSFSDRIRPRLLLVRGLLRLLASSPASRDNAASQPRRRI